MSNAQESKQIHKKPKIDTFPSLHILFRKWSRVLTPSEFAVVSMIFDRTIMWQKEWEKIPERHFLEGVSTKKGCVHAGLNIGRTALKKTLKSLISKGVVRVKSSSYCRGANRYALNMNYGTGEVVMLRPKKSELNPGSLNGETVESPKSPLRVAKNTSQQVTIRPIKDSQQVTIRPTKTKKKKFKDSKKKKLEAPRRDTTQKNSLGEKQETPRERVIAALKNDPKILRGKKTRATRAKKDNPAGWETVWRDEFHECYPRRITAKWSGKEYGIMKNMHKRVNDDLVKHGQTVAEFLRYSIRRWTHVLETKVTGVQEYGRPDFAHDRYQGEDAGKGIIDRSIDSRAFSQMPKRPSVRYMSPCVDIFLEGFSREVVRNSPHMSEDEKAIAALMARKHMSYAEAADQHGFDKARKLVNIENSRRARDLAYQKEEFLQKERQAWKDAIADRNTKTHKSWKQPSAWRTGDSGYDTEYMTPEELGDELPEWDEEE